MGIYIFHYPVRQKETTVNNPIKKLLFYLILLLIPLMVICGMLLLINHHYVKKIHAVLTQSRWPVNAMRYDEHMGFDMTPSFNGELLNHDFFVKTHSLGYRIPEAADPDSLEKGGVLSLGCSFTFGDEVEAEQTFTYILGELLGRPSYNYGVCSYSYASMIRKMQKLDRDGIIRKLEPQILVLGMGEWLTHRSLNPFFPTDMIMQFGYPYIGKNKKTGEIVIKQPADFYSTAHMYGMLKNYFGHVVTRDVPLTFDRYLLISKLNPRILLANIHKSIFKDSAISLSELYTFVLGQINDIASQYDITVLVLWMPITPESAVPDDLKQVLDNFSNVILVDGLQVIQDEHILTEQYNGRHPSMSVHRAYAHACFNSLSAKK